MPNSILQSTRHFKQHFTAHLHAMMAHEDIGVFILVLANAMAKAEIYQQLSDALSSRFSLIQKKLPLLSETQIERVPADDLSVFRALARIDYAHLALASGKSLDSWQLQFHPLRSLRPARNSQHKITRLYQPFDNNSFHFNKAFLSKEILWQGQIGNTWLRLLYNKFPFADYHGLAVINPEQEKPQFLQHADCLETDAVLQALSALDGIGLAYNSLGAYASVNHLHWQLFLSEQAYPVEDSLWTHNGGTLSYPVPVDCFHSLAEAWPQINTCQQTDTAFNLFVRPGKIYLVKRKRQGEYQHSAWTSGFAWSEIMGNIMTTHAEDFRLLDTHAIQQEFKRLSL